MNVYNLSEAINNIHSPNKITIVGIDGLGGAGKSTISKKLAERLEESGSNVTLLHIDDFIHQRAVRYNNYCAEWECYYNLQWRYDYLRSILLPLKSGMAFDGEIELYDKDNDTYFLSKTAISSGSIVVVEGVFLQREELKDLFDYMVYIDIPESERLARVLNRDGYIGDSRAITEKYQNRYFPAEHHYVRECSPGKNADIVL